MNQLYPTIKNLMLTGQFNWLTDDIRIAMYDNQVVFDAAHNLISELAGQRLATSAALPGRTVGDTMVRTQPIRFTQLTTTDDVHALILFRASDDRLIAFMDDVTGFDFKADGADYIFTPTGPNGAIFKL